MSVLADLIAKGHPGPPARPWPRVQGDRSHWRSAIGRLQAGTLTLLDLWAEPGVAHMALLDEAASEIGVVSLDCPKGGFPSVGLRHAPAIRLERTIQDLHGLVPEGALDARPWIDHGRWGSARAAEPYGFLPSVGEGLHQIPVGPVHAGIIEPGHFRFTASGETVVRLEERLGYVHRGMLQKMAGAPLGKAARLAGRVSGDSTVAYALAFARAVEAAAGVEAPARAVWLRALMAELERLANHLGDIGAICNDASFALMHAHCAVLRERVLRACDAAFGHRLMMDCVIPGGIASDLEASGVEIIGGLREAIQARFGELVDLYDDTASLQDRTVGTGRLSTELARRFGAGGYVGRASGRGFDARRALPYPPYDQLQFDTPVREDGDVNARVWIRIEEVRQSLSLVGQLLETLPQGPVRSGLAADPQGEGMALVEGFRGDIFAWVRLAGGGGVGQCRLRDPSWFQWPLLEVCIEGNIVADFPLCNKSFNCSYAGVDL